MRGPEAARRPGLPSASLATFCLIPVGFTIVETIFSDGSPELIEGSLPRRRRNMSTAAPSRPDACAT
jgi:hypothetical protein